MRFVDADCGFGQMRMDGMHPRSEASALISTSILPGQAGVDEAGRGALAGPVVAAAAILDAQRIPSDGWPYRDSKQLSAKKRETLLRQLIWNDATAWSVAWATEAEIDRHNVLGATCIAMERAVCLIDVAVLDVIADGRVKLQLNVPYRCEPKADDNYPAVAAASIIAKVFRDRWMVALDSAAPEYGFAGHKGYGSAAHMAVLNDMGPSQFHRQSFAPVKQMGLGL